MRYNQYKYEVEQEFSDLKEGESRSGQVCPACNGGASKEGSFSVSRSRGVLLYNCFRATCKFGGAIILSSAASRAVPGASRTPKFSHVPTAPLDEETIKLLAQKYSLTRDSMELAGIRRVVADTGYYSGRICFPIYGPDLRQRGACYRSYTGGTPKTLTSLNTSDSIAMSWYIRKRKSPILVIVEDQVSAIRLSSFYDSVALLSTNLSPAKIKEIGEKDYKKVVLCLDNDATALAVKLTVTLRSKIKNLQMVGLAKDVKDMNQEEFDTLLKNLED